MIIFPAEGINIFDFPVILTVDDGLYGQEGAVFRGIPGTAQVIQRQLDFAGLVFFPPRRNLQDLGVMCRDSLQFQSKTKYTLTFWKYITFLQP